MDIKNHNTDRKKPVRRKQLKAVGFPVFQICVENYL